MSGVRTFASTRVDRCPHRHRGDLVPIAATRAVARRGRAARRPSSGRRRATHRSVRSVSPTPGQAACGCTPVDAATIRVQIAGPRRDRQRDHGGRRHDHRDADGGHRLRDGLPGGDGCDRRRRSSTSRPGSDTANSGIVPVSAGGAIDVYANVATDLIVDVTGTFTEATTAASAGRFVPVAPTRLLDTRATGGGPLAPGGTVTVPLPTGVDRRRDRRRRERHERRAPIAGFFSAFPAGIGGSNASFMNPDGSGDPRCRADHRAGVASRLHDRHHVGGHVIVDLVGWFTGPSAPPSSCRTVRADRADARCSTPDAISPGCGAAAHVSSGSPITRRRRDRHQRHAHPHGRGRLRHRLPRRHRPADDLDRQRDDT